MQIHVERLQKKQYKIIGNKITYFLEMENMPPDYPNGSISVQNGVKVSVYGKLEMLKSDIYPDGHEFVSRYHFILLVEIEPIDQNIFVDGIVIETTNETLEFG